MVQISWFCDGVVGLLGDTFLQNSTHVLNKGKQASFLKLSNIKLSDAGKYFFSCNRLGLELLPGNSDLLSL